MLIRQRDYCTGVAQAEFNVRFSTSAVSKGLFESLASTSHRLDSRPRVTMATQDLHIRHLHPQDDPTAAATVGLTKEDD